MTDSMDGMTLCTLWDQMAQLRANDEFLIFHGADGRELSFTYGQFNARINQAANLFLEAGIRKGDTVAVHLCTSVEFIECLFGLAKIGGIMVPVNEQNLQDESLYVLQKCSARMVVTEAKFLDMYRTIMADDPQAVDTLFVARTDEGFEDACNLQQALDRQPVTLTKRVDVTSSDTVEVMFTSGTTSSPKGVEFTHANLLYAGFYGQWQVSMRADDRMMTTMPACHSNFQLAAMMPIIVAGGVLVMVEKYSAHRFWDQARAYRATLTQCVSMMVRTLLLQPPCEDDACNDIREVLYFLPIDTAEKEAFERRFDTRIMNSYGSTGSLTWVITDFPTGKRKWPSVGRVGLGYEAKIVDDQGGEVPVGTIGEIAIKGVPGRTIMKGTSATPSIPRRRFLPMGGCSPATKDTSMKRASITSPIARRT